MVPLLSMMVYCRHGEPAYQLGRWAVQVQRFICGCLPTASPTKIFSSLRTRHVLLLSECYPRLCNHGNIGYLSNLVLTILEVDPEVIGYKVVVPPPIQCKDDMSSLLQSHLVEPIPKPPSHQISAIMSSSYIVPKGIQETVTNWGRRTYSAVGSIFAGVDNSKVSSSAGDIPFSSSKLTALTGWAGIVADDRQRA